MRRTLAAALVLSLGFVVGWGHKKSGFPPGDLIPSSARGDTAMLSDAKTTPFETQWRPATVLKVTDGDTISISTDCGFNLSIRIKARLIHLAALDDPRIGVDTWEIKGEEREKGLKAKARTEELLPVGSEVRIASRKGGSQESLGRWLCCILFKKGDGWVSLGDTLLSEGHAREWWDGIDQGKPRPAPKE